jgi:hypothetical protein
MGWNRFKPAARFTTFHVSRAGQSAITVQLAKPNNRAAPAFTPGVPALTLTTRDAGGERRQPFAGKRATIGKGMMARLPKKAVERIGAVPQRLTVGGAADSAIVWRLRGWQSPVVCELQRLLTGVRLDVRGARDLVSPEWWPDTPSYSCGSRVTSKMRTAGCSAPSAVTDTKGGLASSHVHGLKLASVVETARVIVAASCSE